MIKPTIYAKVYNQNHKTGGFDLIEELVDVTNGVKDYIKINEKSYHYEWNNGRYVEVEYNIVDDDDIPF